MRRFFFSSFQFQVPSSKFGVAALFPSDPPLFRSSQDLLARSFRGFSVCTWRLPSLEFAEPWRSSRISPSGPNVSPIPWTTRTLLHGPPPEFIWHNVVAHAAAVQRRKRTALANKAGEVLLACCALFCDWIDSLRPRSLAVFLAGPRRSPRGQACCRSWRRSNLSPVSRFAALGRFKRPSVRRIGVDLSVPPPAWQLFSVRSEAFPLFP